MDTLREAASRALQLGTPAVLIEVSEAHGSVPRGVGTRMWVSATQALGTIGGGHLELKAIELARGLLADGDPSPRSVHYPLGPALGQCCGGAVTLVYSRFDAAAMAAWPAAGPRFHLQLYGAGHVGRAIARALAPLNVVVDWIDEREEEFPASFNDAHDTHVAPSSWPAHIRKVCVDAVEGEVRLAPPGAFYLVLTHQHDLDLRITEAVLQRGDFGFLGLIGSKTKKQRFIHRFEERGIAAERIRRLTCPIGIEGIPGKEPEIIAASVVAQLLQRAR
jgi:xanthine dehydrogenase accessory factor